jgi:hypothetical protein
MTVDETGFSPGPFEVFDDNDDGTYRLRFVSVIARTYNVYIFTSGKQVLGAPWQITILADELSNKTTASYPDFARAGSITTFDVFPKDKYGNVIDAGDFTDAFSFSYFIDSRRLSDAAVRSSFEKIDAGTYRASFRATTDSLRDATIQVRMKVALWFKTRWVGDPQQPRARYIHQLSPFGATGALFAKPSDLCVLSALQVFLSDTRYGLDMTPIVGSDPAHQLDIVSAIAADDETEIFVDVTQVCAHQELICTERGWVFHFKAITENS